MLPLFRHTSRRTFIKDVHKVIGYSSPFNEEDTKTILSRINSSENPEALNEYLSRPRANILYQHIHTLGPITNIESLLDLKKFDPRVLETMSKKILRRSFSPQHSSNPKVSPKASKNYAKLISPPFLDSPKANSFFTYRIYPDSLTYVHFDRSERRVTEMKSTPLRLNGFDKSFRIEMQDVHQQLRTLAQDIPPSSFFVQEKSAPITSRDASIPFRVALHTLNVTFITLLLEMNSGVSSMDENKLNSYQSSDILYEVRPTLVNSLFNLKIGSERISGSSRVQHLLRQDSGSPFYLNIDEDLWTQSFCQRSPMHQEKLSQVLLLTSAFDYVHRKTI